MIITQDDNFPLPTSEFKHSALNRTSPKVVECFVFGALGDKHKLGCQFWHISLPDSLPAQQVPYLISCTNERKGFEVSDCGDKFRTSSDQACQDCLDDIFRLDLVKTALDNKSSDFACQLRLYHFPNNALVNSIGRRVVVSFIGNCPILWLGGGFKKGARHIAYCAIIVFFVVQDFRHVEDMIALLFRSLACPPAHGRGSFDRRILGRRLWANRG